MRPQQVSTTRPFTTGPTTRQSSSAVKAAADDARRVAPTTQCCARRVAPTTRRARASTRWELLVVPALLASLLLNPAALLMAVPALALAFALLTGRYVGENQIAKLASAFVTGRRRPSSTPIPAVRRWSGRVPRGGRLIAASLAVRPPPAAL